MRALRVEIEGTDGAGKTTGLKYLIEELQKRLGAKVLETREVGSPLIPTCVKLRELVLSPESNMTGEAMEFVFSAMRLLNQEYYKKVEKDYDFIVSDRGLYSHLAYTDHNVSERFTEDLYEKLVMQMTEAPDVVIYFDVSTATALQRRVKRGTGMDVIEMKGVEYQEKVRESFKKYLGKATNTLVLNVNANDTIEGVRSQLDGLIGVIDNYGKAVRMQSQIKEEMAKMYRQG